MNRILLRSRDRLVLGLLQRRHVDTRGLSVPRIMSGDLGIAPRRYHRFRSAARPLRLNGDPVGHVLSDRLDDRLRLILADLLRESLRIRRLLARVLLRGVDTGVRIVRHGVHHRLRVLAVRILRLCAELSVTRWLRHDNPRIVRWLRTGGLRGYLRAVLNRHVLTLSGEHRIRRAARLPIGQVRFPIRHIPRYIAGPVRVLRLRIDLRPDLVLPPYLRVLGLIVIRSELRLRLHWYRLRASLRHCMLSSLGVVFVLAVLGWRQLTDGRMLIFRQSHGLPSS